MKHRFTFFLLLLFSLPALAQRDFRPGFVVRASGDTLRGLVNFWESRSQNQRCFFKATPTATVQEFTTETALGYGFTGDRIYEAITLPRDSVNTSRQVFAWVLIRGRAELLAVGPLFFARKDGEVFALTRSEKIVYIGNKPFKTEDRAYESLLTAYLMTDCSRIDLTGKGGVPYTANALKQLFIVYNRCMNELVELPKPKLWLTWEWAIYGGASVSGLGLYVVRGESTARLSTGLAPTVGVELGISSLRRSERFSTRLGLFRTTAVFTGSAAKQTPTGFYRTDAFLTMTSLQVPLLVRYRVIRTRISPFVQAGAAVRFNTTRSAWYHGELSDQAQVFTDRGALPRLASPGFSALLGAGLHATLSRQVWLRAELRAEQGLHSALEKTSTFPDVKPVSGVAFLVSLGF